MISARDVVLFQGDSITDAGRSRQSVGPNDGAALGSGYAMMAAATLLATQPADALRCFNRGVSGNRVTDLAERWQADCVELQPRVVSILIGVNDTWHQFNNAGAGVPPPRYEQVYRQLLQSTLSALPGVRLVLCEPFVLRCGAVDDAWLPEMAERVRIVHSLAIETGATVVPFQQIFDDAVRQAPPAYWAEDGVHPSLAGHMLMARAWVKAVSKR